MDVKKVADDGHSTIRFAKKCDHVGAAVYRSRLSDSNDLGEPDTLLIVQAQAESEAGTFLARESVVLKWR